MSALSRLRRLPGLVPAAIALAGFVLQSTNDPTNAAAAEIVSQCVPLAAERLRCDIRLGSANEIALVRADWSDGRPATLVFTPYAGATTGAGAGSGSGNGSDWLVVFDRFGADRWRALFAAKQAVLPALAGLAGENRSVGVVAIAAGLDELRPIGSPTDSALKVIPEIEARGDGSRNLMANLGAALAKLGEAQRRRRGLVLVTPALAEPLGDGSATFDAATLATKARAAGVSIFVFAFSGSGIEPGSTEGLRMVAEASGGMLVPVTAEARPLSADIGRQMATMTESGGLVEIATSEIVGQQRLNLVASFANGDSAELAIPVEVAERSFATRTWNWLTDSVSGRPELGLLVGLLAILMPIGVLGTLVMLLGYAIKRRRAAGAADPGRQERERAQHKRALSEAERVASGSQAAPEQQLDEPDAAPRQQPSAQSGVELDRGPAHPARTDRGGAKADLKPAAPRPALHRLRAWLELAEPYTTAADGTPLIPNRPGKINGIGATELPIEQDMVRIGRHDENDICLKNKTVHRYHAVLQRLPAGGFVLTDLSGEAGNGVVVNGGRKEQTELRDGDVIELGEVHLRFRQARISA